MYTILELSQKPFILHCLWLPNLGFYSLFCLNKDATSTNKENWQLRFNLHVWTDSYLHCINVVPPFLLLLLLQLLHFLLFLLQSTTHYFFSSFSAPQKYSFLSNLNLYYFYLYNCYCNFILFSYLMRWKIIVFVIVVYVICLFYLCLFSILCSFWLLWQLNKDLQACLYYIQLTLSITRPRYAMDFL